MQPPSYEQSQQEIKDQSQGQPQDQNSGQYQPPPPGPPPGPPSGPPPGINDEKYPPEKYSSHQYGADEYPPEKQGNEYPPEKQQNGPGYSNNGNNGPPPNTYFVPPQLVNITQANPQHLNPSYQDYLKRDQERLQQGNFPNANNGLSKVSSVDKSSKTGGSKFPGRGGATYNNAANR